MNPHFKKQQQDCFEEYFTFDHRKSTEIQFSTNSNQKCEKSERKRIKQDHGSAFTGEGQSGEEGFEEFNLKEFLQLHKKYGNQWSLMLNHFPGKNVTFLKNHFYSLLRKVFRKINAFLKQNYRISKSVQKTLQLSFIFKLTNLADTERQTTPSQTFFRSILYKILDLHDNQIEHIEESEILEDLLGIEEVYLKNKLRRVGRSRKPTKKQILKRIAEKKITLLMEQVKEVNISKVSEQITIENKIQNIEKFVEVLDDQINKSQYISKTELEVEQIMGAKQIQEVEVMEVEEPMHDLLKDYSFVCNFDDSNDFDPCLFF